MVYKEHVIEPQDFSDAESHCGIGDEVSRRNFPLIRTASELWEKKDDPIQMFEFEHESCLDLEITIVNGENVSKGSSFKDWIDTPDPYIVLKIPGSGNSSKRTSCIDNCVHPRWNETFHFYLEPTGSFTLCVSLMDANYTLDETLGETTLLLSDLEHNCPTEHVFVFPFQSGESRVFASLLLQKNKNPDLRFSISLSEAEKRFLCLRRKKVMTHFRDLLGDKGPRSEREVPTVGIMGSGGGFRAVLGLAGAVSALKKSGIFDCASFICGLSGSSWYISTLYAHDDLSDATHTALSNELKDSVTTNWKWNLMKMISYIQDISLKYSKGQPVSFTDVFGHLLGDVLLKDNKSKKLTDQRKLLESGDVPMPLYSCLHAKGSVSARAFSEWIEFSPYEIGIAKYGTFMDAKHFGSKFIVGKLIKEFEEPPLHFLQGVWGSAFTILVKRLLNDGPSLHGEMIQLHMVSSDAQHRDEESLINNIDADDSCEEDSDTDDDENVEGLDDVTSSDNDESNDVFARGMPVLSDGSGKERKGEHSEEGKREKVKIQEPPEGAANASGSTKQKLSRKNAIGVSLLKAGVRKGREAWHQRRSTRRSKRLSRKKMFESLKRTFLSNSVILNTRTGRAGQILNPFRGLSHTPLMPVSPTEEEPEEEDANDSLGKASRHQPLDHKAKKLFVVDSGLAFNSPYPLLLRPQRAVDLYLSFDFSQRPKDNVPSFKDLILAEKWAEQNMVVFPPIEKLAKIYEKETKVREVYVFKKKGDPSCPTILHFPLTNNKFRIYKEPGVRRSDEERDFADFPLFEDPANPFSCMNFVYTDVQFERLTKLMEFNTLLSTDTIKEELASAVRKKRKHLPKEA